jgi:predicted transcriptional regulator
MKKGTISPTSDIFKTLSVLNGRGMTVKEIQKLTELSAEVIRSYLGQLRRRGLAVAIKREDMNNKYALTPAGRKFKLSVHANDSYSKDWITKLPW